MPGMPPPTAKDDWISQVLATLQELRPDLIGARKFSATIAAGEWMAQRGVEPTHAATDRWVATSAKPKPASKVARR